MKDGKKFIIKTINMKSTMFTLETKDFIKGLIVAVLTPVFVIVQQSIAAGALVFNWVAIGIAALSGLLAYITKNFFTDDTKAAVKTLAKQNVTIIENQPGKGL